MPFRYLRDPLFLACFWAYWIHWILKTQGLSTPLLTAYLNDVICIPFWVPIMLWAARRLRLRPDDAPPRDWEVIIPLVLWSAVFEVILPSTRTWSGLAIADPYDVVAYASGALAAVHFWNWWYRPHMVDVANTAEVCDLPGNGF